MDCSLPDSSVHGDSLGKNTGVGLPCPLAGDLPNPGIKPSFPTGRSLPSEPPGKPKNTRVGRLSLLQGNFPTLELNQGLLHCKRILYQLSYEGSSITKKTNTVQFHLYSVPRAVKIHRDRKYNSGYQGLGWGEQATV